MSPPARMSIFRRMLRLLFLLAGLLAAATAGIAAFLARRMIAPPRQPLRLSPAGLGLPFAEVTFPAQDGLRINGWFIPAGDAARQQRATIILLHGWSWNRLGDAADDVMARLTGTEPVDLLRLAYALHQDGFHVLMFDWRNHGESAADTPVTFGREESRDLLGALAWLRGREDVDPARIGAIGFSMGANALLYTLAQTQEIAAAIAVQPVSGRPFAAGFGADVLGPLRLVALPVAEKLYQAAGGPPLAQIRPGAAAAHAGDVPVLYIQGRGDKWGSVDDVAEMAALTPEARGPLFVESTHRYGGYQYLIENPAVAAAFFEQHFSVTSGG